MYSADACGSAERESASPPREPKNGSRRQGSAPSVRRSPASHLTGRSTHSHACASRSSRRLLRAKCGHSGRPLRVRRATLSRPAARRHRARRSARPNGLLGPRPPPPPQPLLARSGRGLPCFCSGGGERSGVDEFVCHSWITSISRRTLVAVPDGSTPPLRSRCHRPCVVAKP